MKQLGAKDPYFFEDNRSFLTGTSLSMKNKDKPLMSNFSMSKNPFAGF